MSASSIRSPGAPAGRLGLRRVYWYTWSSGYESGDLFDYTGLIRYRGGTYESMPALRAYARSARRN